MDIAFTYSTKDRRAPLGNKTPAELEVSFSNSMYKCFAWHDGHIVGCGRALADGVDCSCICDIAILPECQEIGIGGKIISYLVHKSQDHRKIILYSAPGKEEFYKKYGFLKMNTAMAIFKDRHNAMDGGLVSET